jgi:hypothetical protein
VIRAAAQSEYGAMATWNTAATVGGAPEQVLGVLTEPEACARWSPVRFDLDHLDRPRPVTGTRGRLGGRVVGRRVDFDLEILHADQRRLELRACGSPASWHQPKLRKRSASHDADDRGVRGSVAPVRQHPISPLGWREPTAIGYVRANARQGEQQIPAPPGRRAADQAAPLV